MVAPTLEQALQDPEAFPLYYETDADFLLDNVASGAQGALARLTRDLNNFPHVVYGVRIWNVWTLPVGADAAAVELARYVREWIEPEQTVEIQLAQENVTAQPTLQPNMMGRGGLHWHPFPKPYLMAGGNQFRIIVRRTTGYPQISDTDILPRCHATLVTVVSRADYDTVPPTRRHG